MLKEFLRILAFVCLIIIVAMDDFPFYRKMKDARAQLLLALCVIIFIYYDATFGFIMGLVLLLIYYEIYSKIIKIHENKFQDIEKTNINTNQFDNCVNEIDYISDSMLLSAQNNIFDAVNFQSSIKGLNNGYSIQGINLGYDKDDIYSVL